MFQAAGLEGARSAERLLREARVLSKLRHPAVLRLIDSGRHAGNVFVVVEAPRGELLEEKLKVGPLPIDVTLALAQDIAGALTEAHGLGVIHRGLSPRSIFVTLEGSTHAQIADFGSALFVEATRLSLTQEVHGEIGYMAPEIVEGREPDARADFYSLGVVMFECLTGGPPYSVEGGALQAVMRHLEQPVPRLPERFGKTVADFVERLMSKAPEDRPDSAQTVLSHLTKLATSVRPTSSSDPMERGGLDEVGREQALERESDEADALERNEFGVEDTTPDGLAEPDDVPTLRGDSSNGDLPTVRPPAPKPRPTPPPVSPAVIEQSRSGQVDGLAFRPLRDFTDPASASALRESLPTPGPKLQAQLLEARPPLRPQGSGLNRNTIILAVIAAILAFVVGLLMSS